MQELKDEIHKLSVLVSTLSSQQIGFNGDKKELFDRLSRVEGKVDGLSDKFTTFINTLPCKEHTTKLSDMGIQAEKNKYQSLILVSSFLFSTIAALGVLLEIVKK